MHEASDNNNNGLETLDRLESGAAIVSPRQITDRVFLIGQFCFPRPEADVLLYRHRFAGPLFLGRWAFTSAPCCQPRRRTQWRSAFRAQRSSRWNQNAGDNKEKEKHPCPHPTPARRSRRGGLVACHAMTALGEEDWHGGIVLVLLSRLPRSSPVQHGRSGIREGTTHGSHAPQTTVHGNLGRSPTTASRDSGLRIGTSQTGSPMTW